MGNRQPGASDHGRSKRLSSVYVFADTLRCCGRLFAGFSRLRNHPSQLLPTPANLSFRGGHHVGCFFRAAASIELHEVQALCRRDAGGPDHLGAYAFSGRRCGNDSSHARATLIQSKEDGWQPGARGLIVESGDVRTRTRPPAVPHGSSLRPELDWATFSNPSIGIYSLSFLLRNG
jgi:hypothetical protein